MTARVVGQLEVLTDANGMTIAVPGVRTPRVVAPGSVAEFVRHDDAGRYRPLSGAKTLPTGWIVRLPLGADPAEVIDAVYPLATIHQRQFAEGSLELV
ncbi:MAG: DR2241 family protein, partial [bacterium]